MVGTEVSVFWQWGQVCVFKMVFNRFGVVIKAQVLMETDYQREHTGK